jgi:cytochrome c556
MLENLGAVNQIGEGVAVQDYERVKRAALDLKRRAEAMKEVDIATLGLDSHRDAQFDGYLAAQEEAARSILNGAEQKDGRAVLLGVQHLLGNACIACHQTFREPANRLRPSVLFMTSFLQAWKEMNRGLAINDFSLVSQHARELESMGRVLSWDQVIQSAFGLTEVEQFKAFRVYLNLVLRKAARIEQASIEEDAAKVIEASRQMWNEGCIACHEKFRSAD